MDRGGVPPVSSLRISAAHVAAMRAHVQTCLPLEACGLLAGSEGLVEEVILIPNAASSPSRFRMDPIEQLRAFDRIEAQHMQLLGIFHSHPAGPASPSATDVAEAAYEVVYVIWARLEEVWQVNGYWIRDGQVSEVKLYSADEKSQIIRSA